MITRERQKATIAKSSYFSCLFKATIYTFNFSSNNIKFSNHVYTKVTTTLIIQRSNILKIHNLNDKTFITLNFLIGVVMFSINSNGMTIVCIFTILSLIIYFFQIFSCKLKLTIISYKFFKSYLHD